MAVVADSPMPASSPGRTSRTTLIVLSAVFIAGVVFVFKAALPYFTVNQAQYDVYWPRRWWLLTHVATGILALLSGPIQLWLGLTERRPAIHRRLGFMYMTAVASSAAAGYYLAFTTTFGLAFGAGLAGLATAWLTTTGMAFAAIRKQLYEQHKEWMIRSYVVTTAFVVFRLLFPLLQNSGAGTVEEQLAVAAWSAWALPLVATEAVLQGRKIAAVKDVSSR